MTQHSTVATIGLTIALKRDLSPADVFAQIDSEGICGTDIDECASSPCQEDATCVDLSQCRRRALVEGGSEVTGGGSGGTSPPPPGPPGVCSPIYDAYACECAPGWADGLCAYEYIEEYAEQCGVSGGNCDVDVDECASAPCENGGVCFDLSNSTDPDLAEYDAFQCDCTPGYRGDRCTDVIDLCEDGENDCDESRSVCVHLGPAHHICECVAGYGPDGWGNWSCVEDLNECMSAPCQNDAVCTDSNDDNSIPVDAFSCTCAAGFTDGSCGYNFSTVASIIGDSCSIPHSTMAYHTMVYNGTCDEDIDECASSPCTNGGTCQDSGSAPNRVPHFSYLCDCVAGYIGTNCDT
eukprot:SAG31_NODE_5044_length_2779_cov_1.922388_2_plen_350_part_01